jgi:hypothetical protein
MYIQVQNVWILNKLAKQAFPSQVFCPYKRVVLVKRWDEPKTYVDRFDHNYSLVILVFL